MAGGVGSRFWPMSRPERPKQFIDVLGVGRTLIQLTVDRFGSSFKPENTWVVTSKSYKQQVCEQLPDIPESNILLEPCMRNTAPCIAYVVWKIMQREPDATVVVTAADHFVVDTEEFRRVIAQGIDFVRGTARVLTLGMKPTRPDTGYGYIQSGEKVDANVHRVESFREKPQLSVAEQYLADGSYYWNAGIFLWDARTAQEALRHFQPKTAALFDNIASSFYTEDEQQTVDEHFPQCESISIDYAVMEPLGGHETEIGGRQCGVYVMPSDFGWSDLGTWGSLYAQKQKDADNNAVIGEAAALVECSDCIVRTSGKLRMVLQGLEGYIVADDHDTLLVCKKSEEQRIKAFSEQIKK